MMKTMNLMDFNQVALLTCFHCCLTYAVLFTISIIHVFMTKFVVCFFFCPKLYPPNEPTPEK